ncbi:unnamed protein product [Urochloa humidicola]
MPSSAAAAPRSSLEAMLETIRRRDEPAEDATTPFLPPLPARPRCRGRPTGPRRRRPRSPGLVKLLGNGDGLGAGITVPVDGKKMLLRAAPPSLRTGRPPASSSTRPSSSSSTFPSRRTEPPFVRAEGSREMAAVVLEHRGRWWRCF